MRPAFRQNAHARSRSVADSPALGLFLILVGQAGGNHSFGTPGIGATFCRWHAGGGQLPLRRGGAADAGFRHRDLRARLFVPVMENTFPFDGADIDLRVRDSGLSQHVECVGRGLRAGPGFAARGIAAGVDRRRGG